MLAAEGMIDGVPPASCIVFDVETTGLRDDDEILRINAVDGHGRAVMDQLFRPVDHLEWPRATEINGITPDMVRNAPTFESMSPMLKRYLGFYKCIVGYGLNFDVRMLAGEGLDISEGWRLVDVREIYADVAGGGFGPPLANAAIQCGYSKLEGRFVKPRMALYILENLMYRAEKAGRTLDEIIEYHNSKRR